MRLKKIERASRRAFDRRAFEDQTRIDPLPAEGRNDVEDARHRWRLLIAAGGHTIPARLAVHRELQRVAAERGDPAAQREIARLQAIDAGIDDWKWRNMSTSDKDDWGLGEKRVIAGSTVVVTDEIGSPIRTLPPAWWVTHPGAAFEEMDDAPSPPRYSKALPFI